MTAAHPLPWQKKASERLKCVKWLLKCIFVSIFTELCQAEKRSGAGLGLARRAETSHEALHPLSLELLDHVKGWAWKRWVRHQMRAAIISNAVPRQPQVLQLTYL